MTAKRDTSRQRRVNQNRAAREALAARREAANAPKVEADTASTEAAADDEVEPEPAGRRARGRSHAQAAPVVAPKSAAKETAASSTATGRATSSTRSRVTPPPAHDEAPRASGFLGRTQQLAGGRQMLAGFVLAVTGSLAAGVLPIVQVKENGKTHSETLLEHFGASSLTFLLIPIVFAAVPLLFLNHRRRRLAWNIGTFLMGLWALQPGLGIFYLFAVVAMVWGIMKASRVEGPAGKGFARFRRQPAQSEPDSTNDSTDTLDVDGAEVEPDRPTGMSFSRFRRRPAPSEPDSTDDSSGVIDAEGSEGATDRQTD